MLASVRCKIENIYYDFLKLLEKEQKYYRVASVIFLVAYLLSLLIKNETINNLLVVIVFSVLFFSIVYLRPPEKY